jgi:hypothetical protein
MWCKNIIEIRDNPDYQWSFCPKCGKSWFNRKDCRERGTPKWFYERWGNWAHPWQGATIACEDGSKWVSAEQLRAAIHPPKKFTSHWLIERRTKWVDDDAWGEWEYYEAKEKDPNIPDWKWAYSMLQNERSFGSDRIEYRVRLVKK